jgi:chorismate mutase
MLIDGKREGVTWYFDRQEWNATKEEKGEKKVLASGVHPCGECPVLIFSESGQFPEEGQFAQIADLSKRLFNANSELDEMMRAVTFPMFGLHIPPEHAHLIDIGGMIETIGTQNAIKYHGDTPTYIAPPNGPAEVYFQRIKELRQLIDEIALKVEGTDQQESGIALQMRFQALNSALAMWAERMEDFEKRVWELVKKWLGITWADDPEIKWERNFTLADIAVEMSILEQMQTTAMPEEIIQEQIKRIVSIQFGGLDQERLDEILANMSEHTIDVTPPDGGR